LVCIALALRLLWAWYSPAKPTSDFGCYDHLAWSMVQGKGYQFPPQFSAPTAFWPPGYPLFLAIVYKVAGHSYRVAYLLNAVLGALSCYLILLLGRQLLSDKIAWLGAYALAFYPNHIVLSGLLASENLFCPLLLAALVLIWSWPLKRANREALIAGLLLGCAALTRLVGLVVLLPAMWAWKNSLGAGSFRQAARGGGFVVLGCMISLVPWVLRNEIVFGEFPIVSTSSWFNLYEGVRENGAWWGVRQQGHPLAIYRNEAERERVAHSLWWQAVQRDPFRLARLCWPKARILFKLDGGYLSHFHFAETWRQVPSVGLQEGFLYILTTLCTGLWWIGIATGFLLSRNRSGAEMALVAVSLCIIAVHCLSLTSDRYRVPLEVLWTPYYGLGLNRLSLLWQEVHGRRRRRSHVELKR